MTEERRAALRARADLCVQSWDRDTKERGQDELDLLAALEAAEARAADLEAELRAERRAAESARYEMRLARRSLYDVTGREW